ncbi:hypothetical protein HPB47_015489 [Ixodes persulcatus]|uniref:Uncharacterized protein n=1 Tax=Ixodes persulcatus TaxID=34615 RepID=A0AC60QTH8_IXOPE|nr:hypothetical protein HPB47_015489 [Ixodes persulcatus]
MAAPLWKRELQHNNIAEVPPESLLNLTQLRQLPASVAIPSASSARARRTEDEVGKHSTWSRDLSLTSRVVGRAGIAPSSARGDNCAMGRPLPGGVALLEGSSFPWMYTWKHIRGSFVSQAHPHEGDDEQTPARTDRTCSPPQSAAKLQHRTVAPLSKREIDVFYRDKESYAAVRHRVRQNIVIGFTRSATLY